MDFCLIIDLPPFLFERMPAASRTAKSGIRVASMGVMRPELVVKSIVPSRRHGGSAWNLRSDDRRRGHQHGDTPRGEAVLPLRRLRLPLVRCRPGWRSGSSAMLECG